VILAQIDTVLSAVDKASASSDRWLFLLALGIIILGGVAVIRYLVASLERKDATHAAAWATQSAEHAKERLEWKISLEEAKSGFLLALKEQRDEFRAELSLERAATSKMAQTVESLARQLAGCSSAAG
jgi:hypothetical protein